MTQPASRSRGQCSIVKPDKNLEKEITVFIEKAIKINKISQQLFTVNGIKVAIIFNPTTQRRMVVAGIDVGDKVAIVAEKKLPQQITDEISAIIPSRYNIHTQIMSQCQGKPIFQYLGLE